jgi:hypothetical protein
MIMDNSGDALMIDPHESRAGWGAVQGGERIPRTMRFVNRDRMGSATDACGEADTRCGGCSAPENGYARMTAFKR